MTLSILNMARVIVLHRELRDHGANDDDVVAGLKLAFPDIPVLEMAQYLRAVSEACREREAHLRSEINNIEHRLNESRARAKTSLVITVIDGGKK